MISSIFRGYADVLRDSFLALAPLLLIVLIYQMTILKSSRKNFLRVLIGILLTYIGLTLFLQGVMVGYIRAGSALGELLASLAHNWVLVPIGFLLGFAVTLAEPAVYVLVQEIERVTSGFLPKRLMLTTLAIGVAVAVALAMLKILLDISLWFFIVPGYLLALALAHFVSPDFTSIAFDAGGVATGTMTATFLLSLAIGAATQIEHTDPLLDAFGTIALVALFPTLTVLTLGFLYGYQERRNRAARDKLIKTDVDPPSTFTVQDHEPPG